MALFSPDPNDTIEIAGSTYRVSPHPQGPSLPFAAEGRKGVVYQLRRDTDASLHALKVFKAKYRVQDESLEASLSRVAALRLPGLRALYRSPISLSDPAVRKYSNLQGAVLMPWIPGNTWFDVLNKARAGEYSLKTPDAVKLAAQFLDVVAGIESRGVAHCDISPANVLLNDVSFEIELIDLEDMYFHGATQQGARNLGTPGYRSHSVESGEPLWGPFADRYAAAVLAAEILLLTNPEFARQVSEDGFFQSNQTYVGAERRFKEGQRYLDARWPIFSSWFSRAWYAPSLAASPSIAELLAALRQDLAPKSAPYSGPSEKSPAASWSSPYAFAKTTVRFLGFTFLPQQRPSGRK